MKALLLIDIQNDFLKGGSLPVPSGETIFPFVNEIQKNYQTVLASKDWHPPDHISFGTLWPVHCVQNTKGAEFHPLLETKKIKKVFYKGSSQNVDSYSAFFDNEHLQSTGLDEFLKKEGIDEIDVVGLATDYCVRYTVLDGLDLGYQVRVLLPGCSGISQETCEKAIDEMKKAGATVCR